MSPRFRLAGSRVPAVAAATAAVAALALGLALALAAHAADPGPPAAPPVLEALPESYRDAVRRSLAVAGDHAPALEGCVREILRDPPAERDLELEAVAFLLANLSPADLAAVEPDLLLEHVAWLGPARRHLPWVARVPKEILLHYVLPPRLAQERLGPWRRELFQALAPRVRALPGMAEVALEVNRWCGERVRFVSTEFRDQGPMETLRSGYGRCEEMMIVYLAAARSVGIPARSCSTPWWATCDNNHAWVEVWTDGAWHFLGACEPAPQLDQAWFGGPARRAAAVYSACFGLPAPPGEEVYREGPGFALLNTTAVYSRVGRLRVEVVGPDGRPAADCPVTASVFNYGALRAIARKNTGADGTATLALGIGDFAVTAGTSSDTAFAVVRNEPGKTTDVRLVLRYGAAPPPRFWLRYPRLKD